LYEKYQIQSFEMILSEISGSATGFHQPSQQSDFKPFNKVTPWFYAEF